MAGDLPMHCEALEIGVESVENFVPSWCNKHDRTHAAFPAKSSVEVPVPLQIEWDTLSSHGKKWIRCESGPTLSSEGFVHDS